MPRASEELRAAWADDDGVGEGKAAAHLEQNYTLTRRWTWVRKCTDYETTDDDRGAAQFLCDEWDYDGIEL